MAQDSERKFFLNMACVSAKNRWVSDVELRRPESYTRVGTGPRLGDLETVGSADLFLSKDIMNAVEAMKATLVKRRVVVSAAQLERLARVCAETQIFVQVHETRGRPLLGT
uniref:Uncharacterized protein n=1 Tax=Noctiluca scintillans TaxID=2966 RepID=A0A7S1AKH5_NOCSC